MNIYNFCIIAHIDHGKSTLADRMLELTGTVDKRHMKEQLLDSMELERERGITIKLQPVRMSWPPAASHDVTAMGDRRDSVLNLIDTPGHVDFQYEVSRSLQAVEGAILLVDATQGVQAQTIANLYLALEQNLVIIPVINKVDLPAADVKKTKKEIISLLGGREEDILLISAKTGEGVEKVLDAILSRVPAAEQVVNSPLRALIFDSVYDDYKGVVAYVRVVEGKVKARDEIVFLGTGASDRAVEVGIFNPDWQVKSELSAGEIGYIATGLKDVRQARVGDTIALVKDGGKLTALLGFSIPQPKVFAGIFPERGDDFPILRDAIGELLLSDSSISVVQERSDALGQGFHCGFLGMLHMDIVQERLHREHKLDLVITTPSVAYKIMGRGGKEIEANTPASWPDPSNIESIKERYAAVDVLTPVKYMGAVFEIMQDREAVIKNQHYLEADRVQLTYEMPLRELVVDLYDHLKSVTAGYGSMSYELTEWRDADVVKLAVMVNHETVEALSVIVARSRSEAIGRRMVKKLKEVIPRQLFAIPIQAAIGGNIIARETLPAMRKDVTGYLYGGDVTRKRKLLEKQKKGKKRMGQQGKVKIPTQAYLAVLKRT
ncbi:MAG: translation elongation factor 4 [bacterium]|nr:translation elongation factor 4 [bacterium]